jgi:addiction module HigA family antidote
MSASIHPGKVILEQFMAPNQLSTETMVQRLGYRIKGVLARDCKITVEMAYRLGQAFGNGAEYWLNLQRDYDAAKFERNPDAMAEIRRIQPFQLLTT